MLSRNNPQLSVRQQKSSAAANRPSKMYGSVVFQDNRSEAITQRKIINAIGKAVTEPQINNRKPGAIQRSSINPNSKTIQRLVNRNVDRRSENGLYMTKKNDSSVLYSTLDANKPLPTGLYVESEEKFYKGFRKSSRVKKWEPNVGLFKDHSESRDLEREKMANTLEIDKKLSKGMNKEEGAATMGIAGRNDCGEFARLLNDLIHQEHGEDLPDQGNLGGTLKANYDPEWDGCSIHAATEVAIDGASKITLEAHAAKDIDKPEFAIYNGKEGFEQENIRPETNDNIEEIKPGTGHLITLDLNSPNEKEKLKTNYEKWNDSMRHVLMGLKTEKEPLIKHP